MPNTIELTSGIGATLQLLALSIDTIIQAGQRDAAYDTSKNTSKVAGTSKSTGTGAGDNETSNLNSKKSNKIGLVRGGSVMFDRFSMSRKSSVILSGVVEEGEEQDDDGIVVKGDVDVDEVHLNEHQRLISYINYLAFGSHLGALLYFLIGCVLVGSNNEFLGTSSDEVIFDAVPMGCVAVAIFIHLLGHMQDSARVRFSHVQRTLYLFSFLLIMLGCIYGLGSSDEGGVTSVDVVSISVSIYLTLLSMLESKLFPYPEPSQTPAGSKRSMLNRKALMIILKPYFWPDATATSATVNRTRALLTWVFVFGAKACSLTAPIYIGKAASELAKFEYTEAIKYIVVYAALVLGSSLFKESQSLIYLKVAQAAFVQLSEASFKHLHSLSLDWHLRKKLGEVIRQMDRGIQACDILMKYLFLWLVPAFAECLLVTIIFATYFNYFPLAISIFFFVYTYVVVTIVVTLWRKKFRKSVAKSDNDWHDKCTDSLVNFETVKYFTAEEYEMKRFGTAVEKYQRGSVNVQASLSFLNISQQVLMQVCIAISLSLAVIGIKQRIDCCVDNGCEDEYDFACCSSISQESCPGMNIGDFVAVLSYTTQIFIPLNFLGSVYNMVVMSLIDLADLSTLLAENPDITDAVDAVTLPKSHPSDPSNMIEFDKVVFRYPSQQEGAGLKGISFKMKKGTTTAIVGPTGSGKTTVSRLLFRFYDVLGGAIKVNGIDIRTVKQSDLRSSIGVVPQATCMFNDTIGYNIKYGKQDATDEDLEQVAKDAQIDSFIKSLPDGWNSLVGDRGLKLSGGEKQRIAIARCLLKNPSIVILDEATSALDTITENSVQAALDRLGEDRTVLVIAHRLGTIRNADNIIVLKEGAVAEEGTHDELLSKGELYADMWNMQLHSTSDSRGNLIEDL